MVIDPATHRLAGFTIQDQTRQALVNCQNILRAAGAELEHVIDGCVLLADPADFAGLNGEPPEILSDESAGACRCQAWRRASERTGVDKDDRGYLRQRSSGLLKDWTRSVARPAPTRFATAELHRSCYSFDGEKYQRTAATNTNAGTSPTR